MRSRIPHRAPFQTSAETNELLVKKSDLPAGFLMLQQKVVIAKFHHMGIAADQCRPQCLLSAHWRPKS
jgi:hypothetical protein